MSHEATGIVPLLLRTSFRAGESLPSLLERLRVMNLYVARESLYDLCRASLPRRLSDDTPDAPSYSETYAVLSRLLVLPAKSLYDATIQRFEACLRMPDNPAQMIRLASGEQVNVMRQPARLHHVRSGIRATFCRLCLKESAYQRTIWLPQLTTVCLEHGCLLEERCSYCHALQNVSGIVANLCVKCASPLSDGSVLDLSDDAYNLETAKVFASWFGERSVDSSRYGIPDHPSNVLYRLLDGLRQCLSNKTHDINGTYWRVPTGWSPTIRSFKRKPAVAEDHILYMTAMKAVYDWPHGFHDFLNAYDSREADALGTTLNDGFGTLYTVWLSQNWASSTFDFVREAFDAYLTSGRVFVPSAVKSNRHRQALLDDWEYLTVKDAMQKLGIGQDTLETLLTTGTLHEAFPRDQRPFRYRLVARREVEALREAWADGLALPEASAVLGLSETLVADLARDGHFDVLRKPQEGSAGWLLRRVSVEAYRNEILTHTQPVQPTSGETVSLIDLKRAAQIFGPVGGNALTLLARVASGRLRAYVSVNASETPGNLIFIESDIMAAIEQIKAENDWYDAWDIAALLHLKRTVIDKWIVHGLLVPVTRSGLAVYFNRMAVQRFIDDHVFVEDAAEIMDIGVLAVQKWARAGRLKAVSGPDIDGCHRWLFRRADVEQLRPENRLTAPQAAKLMGIGEATLSRWIREGKVNSVSGPGIDGMRQHLFLRKKLLLLRADELED